MKKLLSFPNLPEQLIKLIDSYNELPEDNHVDRLYYLQKITYFIQNKENISNEAVIEWKNQSQVDLVMQTTNSASKPFKWKKQEGDSSLETHLQHYGIARDASIFLQSIEFANAVDQYGSPASSSVTLAKDSTFYSAMRELNQLFRSEDVPKDTLQARYIQHNRELLKHSKLDPDLKKKVERHIHFLRLCYAKIDAIQGLVQQKFSTYATKVLGDPEGRNKNFIFKIGDVGKKPEQLVIRVEERLNLGDEQELQSWEVSKDFSEDYATFIVTFNVGGYPQSRPVVISEFAKEGDLSSYAQKLAGKNPDQIVAQARYFFDKFNTFNLNLMASKHYHPDLKLSNFLTDGEKIIISDRKTFKDNENPKADTVNSTKVYAPKEYRQCFGGAGFNKGIAAGVTLNMPTFMAFQTGMALKEWMILSQIVPFVTEDDVYEQLDKWEDISKFVTNPPNSLKNMSVLIQELTRDSPEDRLSIKNFQSMLSLNVPSDQYIIDLPPEQFMAMLEKIAPREHLSISKDLKDFERIFHEKKLSYSMKEKLDKLSDFEALCNDPRINLSALLKGEPSRRVALYMAQVNNLLLDKGLDDTAQLDPQLLPKLDELTRAYLTAANIDYKDEMWSREQLKELMFVINKPIKPVLDSKPSNPRVEETEPDAEVGATTIVTPGADASGTTIVTPDADASGTTIVTPDAEVSGTTIVSSEGSGNKLPAINKKEPKKPDYAGIKLFEKDDQQVKKQSDRKIKGIAATIEQGNKEKLDYFKESGFDTSLEELAQKANQLMGTGRGQAAERLFAVINKFNSLKKDFLARGSEDKQNPKKFVEQCEKVIKQLKAIEFEFSDPAQDKKAHKKDHRDLSDKILEAIHKIINFFKKSPIASGNKSTLEKPAQDIVKSLDSLHFAFFGKHKKEKKPKEKSQEEIVSPKKNG